MRSIKKIGLSYFLGEDE